jgi:hypothetical protein
MSYTLCIIDVQPEFSAAYNKRTQQNCIREIKKAMRDKAAILFVEFLPEIYGPTFPMLTNITKKYKKVYRVSKGQDNGGYEVVQCLIKNHLPRNKVRVCGVNSDFCVRATVEGVVSNRPNTAIHVVADACHTDSGAIGHKDGIKKMKELKQVKIIRHH